MARCYSCFRCNLCFESRTAFYTHMKRCKNEKRFKCGTCGVVCRDRKLLWNHRQREHTSNSHLQSEPWGNNVKDHPWMDDKNNVINENLKRVYNTHKSIILKSNDSTSESVGSIKTWYNFPVKGERDIDFKSHLYSIFVKEKQSFKINLSFGVILRHTESGEYRYFVPYSNSEIFERPQSVTNLSNVDQIYRSLREFSVDDQVLLLRPNTKWKPVLITNVSYVVYRTSFPLGAEKHLSPIWLKKKKSVHTLDYGDGNLCAFRCLAFHLSNQEPRKRLEKLTKQLFKKWCDYKKYPKSKKFAGILLPDDIPEFESVFGININIFQFHPLTESAETLYLSKAHNKTYTPRDSTMNLNCYRNHLSYISNISAYTRKHKCRHCDRMFSKMSTLKIHERSPCWKRTIFNYPGGYYSPPKSLFERLRDIAGIGELQCYEWFIMFDFESMLLNVREGGENSTTWTRKHHPISVSLCSNVPGFDSPVCFVNPNIEELLKDMVDYLHKIVIVASKITEEKLEDLFSNLEEKIKYWGALCEVSNISEEEEEEEEEDESEGEEGTKTDITTSATKMHNALLKLRTDLQTYCGQIPVLGFNSSKYDLNLIKSHLANIFELCDRSSCFVVKKHNQYLCITTPQFRILDISQYLPPGTSYDQFLKTFKMSQKKGFFCYEYLDSVEKLKESQLPPINAFWSSLKNRNTLEDEKFREYSTKRETYPNRTEECILKEMGLNQRPKSKEENYNYLKNIWKREEMTTLKDLLIWYNNLDVAPGVQAIAKLKEFYWEEMKVDVFKDVISVSGISRILLFRMAKESGFAFSSIDNSNRDLHECIKTNIVGGPSIIFTRYHNAGETYLRRNPEKICKSCVGYDANALYLNCLSLELPVSYFVRWLPAEGKNSNSFKRDKSERYTIAYDWLDWIAYRDSLFISHKLNSGSEKSIGPYFVDGFNESNNTCYEFYGCYFHSCPKENCTIYKIKKDHNRYVRTMQREAFINKMGYRVISIWECEFKELINSNSKLRNFLQQKDLQFSRTHSHREVKQSDILEGVVNESFFGMVEVDIHVPSCLYSYFEEMSPLFVTSKIPFQNIGEHMQKYVKDQNLEENHRTLLVSGMKARKILLASPLLKWYLDHGLSVTRVHQAVEFGRGRCFKSFTERITEARRMGDIDPDVHIKADVMKLIGNSAYGSLLMQKEKHTSCKYVHGVHKAKLQVNKAQFVSLTELPSENYEIISSKRRTNLNLPTQVGFFVLQYAKLRMLEFYYNFLDVFADRRDFECLQMDTDSLYLAISGNDLSDIIRPEKKEDYNHMLRGYCNQNDVISDASNHFFPRTCCEEHAKRDKRTPGLFKLESRGVKMISLNSKTYVLQTDERNPEKVKLSSKGLNKSSIKQAVKTYERVLDAKESQCAVNTGFRSRDNTVYSYQQVRWGMSYFYCKRVVQSDGVSTKPLDLELVPAKLMD